jgi:hypothetical protein
MRTLLVAVALVLASGAAHAQSPYVAATIGADISRFGHSDSTFSLSPTNDHEVISGSVRVGTLVGQNWGVELEFVRSGSSRAEVPPPVPLPFAGVLSNLTPGALPVSVIAFQADVRQSHYEFDTVAWVRQAAGSKVDLVYLGGVAFSHQRTEISQTFPTVMRSLLPAGPFRTTVVDYSSRPLVGAEARIALTSHLRLIPGVRLEGLTDGWLLRPYAGLGWSF